MLKRIEDLEQLASEFERLGHVLDGPGSGGSLSTDERIRLGEKRKRKQKLTTREEKWLWGFRFRAQAALMKGEAANARRLLGEVESGIHVVL